MGHNPLSLNLPERRYLVEYRLPVGSVLGRTLSITLARLPSFGFVGLVLAAPAIALELVLNHFAPQLALRRLLAGAVDSVFDLVLTGALTFAVIGQLRGRAVSIEDSVRTGLASLGRVFTVSLYVALASTLGYVFCIAPGFVVVCMNWVAVPVAVAERSGYAASLERSQDLTAGTRWPVFAVVLVLYVMAFVVRTGSTMGLVALTTRFPTTPWVARDLVPVLSAVLELPLAILYAVASAVGYHDLRLHREGAAVEDLVKVFE